MAGSSSGLSYMAYISLSLPRVKRVHNPAYKLIQNNLKLLGISF